MAAVAVVVVVSRSIAASAAVVLDGFRYTASTLTAMQHTWQYVIPLTPHTHSQTSTNAKAITRV